MILQLGRNWLWPNLIENEGGDWLQKWVLLLSEIWLKWRRNSFIGKEGWHCKIGKKTIKWSLMHLSQRTKNEQREMMAK